MLISDYRPKAEGCKRGSNIPEAESFGLATSFGLQPISPFPLDLC